MLRVYRIVSPFGKACLKKGDVTRRGKKRCQEQLLTRGLEERSSESQSRMEMGAVFRRKEALPLQMLDLARHHACTQERMVLVADHVDMRLYFDAIAFLQGFHQAMRAAHDDFNRTGLVLQNERNPAQVPPSACFWLLVR